MKHHLIIFISFLAVLGACSEKETTSSTSFEVIESPKYKPLDSLYSQLFQNEQFNGNVLIAENGKIIYQHSFGLANEKDSIPLNLETVFELASVSKQFTAMGIVLLQKQGKIAYKDDITDYIPELKYYEGITIQNLLTHTSGLPDYMQLTEKEWNKSQIATNDDIIKLFQTLRPERAFQPNQQWEYSNTGYLLLATIIERVSGKAFGEYLHAAIFKPLQMTNTFVYRRRFKPEQVHNYAQGYMYADSLQRKILPDELGEEFYVVYLDGIVGDGMVNSNLYDLLTWDRALYSNKLINDEDRSLIFSSYQTTSGAATDYGFGWQLDSTETYGKIVSHSGGWAGYISYIERHLDNDKTIIFLQNNSKASSQIPVTSTRRIMYGLPLDTSVKVAQEVLKKYAGTYMPQNNKEKQIVFEEGKLWVPINPQVKLELIPVSQTKFKVDAFSPEVSYTFILNEDNEVEKFRVQQQGTGLDQTATKIK